MILLLGGEKGGTGKSTLATNLAAWLAVAGRDVILVDTDVQRTAAHWVDRLTAYGVPVPPAPTRLDPTNTALVARARGAGFADVLRDLEQAESTDAGVYDAEPED